MDRTPNSQSDSRILSDEAEKKLKQEIKESTYYDNFDKRMDILISFAVKKNLSDKVEHIFGSVITGISAALQNEKLDLNEFPPSVRAGVIKNILNLDQAKELLERAVDRILVELGPESLDEMKELWFRQRQNTSGEVLNVGNEPIREDLGDWNPFSHLEKSTIISKIMRFLKVNRK